MAVLGGRLSASGMENLEAYTAVLTIAGSDSIGGAGIQADIKTISACGCYGASVITAVTAQNTSGVIGVHPVPIQHLAEQLDAVCSDVRFDAVKIGMLHSSEAIQIIKKSILKYRLENIVLDPVMVTTSGDRLLRDESVVETLQSELLPLARLITPNRLEAEILLNNPLDNQCELAENAVRLAEKYQTSVLLKGGHFREEKLTDVLFNFTTGTTSNFESKRIHTPNTHGTGCTLSSAIASFLALHFSLEEAVEKAVDYLHGALRAGKKFKLGQGYGPVHHFYRFW